MNILASKTLDLPIDLPLIPLVLTIAIIAFGGLGVLVLGFGNAKIKKFSMGGGTGSNNLSKEYRDELLKAYNNVFASFNMKAMTSMLTENMHYTTKRTLDVLQKLGIKKTVSIKVDEEMEKARDEAGISIIQDAGKNDFTLHTTPCEYTETYEDTTNGKKLYSETRKLNYTMHFLKSNQVERNAPTYCINCGTQMDIKGDFFDCPNCKSHYSAENYQWMVSDVELIEDMNAPTALILAGFGILIGMSVVEAIIANVIFGLIIIALDALALCGILYYFKFLNNAMQQLKAIEKDDPLSSRMTLIKRILYLIRTLEMSKDFDINEIKPFTTPELFKKLKDVNKYDDYYLLDLRIPMMVISNYHTEGEYRHFDAQLTIMRLMMNPRKKIKVKKAKAKYSFMKHKDALTEVNQSAKSITCPSCSANMNLTLSGKCKFCGTDLDMARHDWILSDAPLEITK